jgi:hypothetical protein
LKKIKPTSKEITQRPTKQRRLARRAVPEARAEVDERTLLADLRELINAARQRVATAANSTHTLLYWHVGQRLLRENLHESRAAYGKRILATLSQELIAEYGAGFTLRSLYRFIQFSQLFPDEGIVSALSTQLSWSRFMEVLSIKDVLARDFYAEMCRIERWDVRTLRQKIAGMLFERTALSKNTREVISSEIAILRDGLHPALTRRAIRCRTWPCSRIGTGAWSSPGFDTPGYTTSHLAVLGDRERRLPDHRQSLHAKPQGP